MTALFQKRLNVVHLPQRKPTLADSNRELKGLRRNEMMHGARATQKKAKAMLARWLEMGSAAHTIYRYVAGCSCYRRMCYAKK